MPPIKHSLTGYITVLNEKANKSNHYALCCFCKTKLTNTKKLEKYTEHKQEKILFPGNENNQYDGSPEFDSSSSICTNESSILSSSSSTLSVEKSGNKKRKISNYFAHSIPLSKQDKEHWEKLVLNSTIGNGWSFRWVDKKSSQILFNFANPGLKLPSHKVLAGHILTSNSDKIRNSSVLITSHGQVLIWGGEVVSRNRLQWQNIKELSLNFLDKLDKLNIKYNAMFTDSASQNQKTAVTRMTWFFFGPCFAHQTNLIVGKIFKESSSLVVSSKKAIQIISFLNRSVYFMEKLCDEQKFKYNKYFAVLLPCATRWNSHYHCYSSLLRNQMLVSKYSPREFEVDDNYTGNDENDREMPLGICRIIANEDWWKDIKKLEKFCFHFVFEKVFAMSQMKGEFQRLEQLENIQNSNKKFKTRKYSEHDIQSPHE
ncbi:7037_t:CDS:2 [Entrophospora sp. SA101]|nr:7037_t:CDS:2 [Entrophospora sp. SA101]